MATVNVNQGTGTAAAKGPAVPVQHDQSGVFAVVNAYTAFVGYSGNDHDPTQSYDAYAAAMGPVPASPAAGANTMPFGYRPSGKRTDASLVLSCDDTTDKSSPNGGLAGKATDYDKAGFYVPGETQSGIAAAATPSAASRDATVTAGLASIVDASAACDARGAVLAYVAASGKSDLAKRKATDWWKYELPALVSGGGAVTSINGVNALVFGALGRDTSASADERLRVQDAVAQAGQLAMDPALVDTKSKVPPTPISATTRMLSAAQAIVSGIFGRTVTNQPDISQGTAAAATALLVSPAAGASLLGDVTANYTNPTDVANLMQFDGESTFASAVSNIVRPLAFMEVESRAERGFLPAGAAAPLDGGAGMWTRLEGALPFGRVATVAGLADDEGDRNTVSLSAPESGVALLTVTPVAVGGFPVTGLNSAPATLVQVTETLGHDYVVPKLAGAGSILSAANLVDSAGGNVIDETSATTLFNVDTTGARKGDVVRISGSPASPTPFTVRGKGNTVDASKATYDAHVDLVGDGATFIGPDAYWVVEVDGRGAAVHDASPGSVGTLVLDAGAEATVDANHVTASLSSGATEHIAAAIGNADLRKGSQVTVDLGAIAAGQGGSVTVSADDGLGSTDLCRFHLTPFRVGGAPRQVVVDHYRGDTLVGSVTLANSGTASLALSQAGHWMLGGTDLGAVAFAAGQPVPTPAPAPSSPALPPPVTSQPSYGPQQPSYKAMLTGGTASHAFVFSPGEGSVAVTDFRSSGPAPDTLDFAKSMYGTPQAALAAAIQHDGDVIIGANSKDPVTLLHTDLSSLAASSFK